MFYWNLVVCGLFWVAVGFCTGVWAGGGPRAQDGRDLLFLVLLGSFLGFSAGTLFFFWTKGGGW